MAGALVPVFTLTSLGERGVTPRDKSARQKASVKARRNVKELRSLTVTARSTIEFVQKTIFFKRYTILNDWAGVVDEFYLL